MKFKMNEQGVAFLLVLVAVVIVAVSVIAIAAGIKSQYNTSDMAVNTKIALNQAENGLILAKTKIQKNVSFTNFTFTEAGWTVNVVYGSDLRSTATKGRFRRTVAMNVTETSGTNPATYNYTMFTGGDLTLTSAAGLKPTSGVTSNCFANGKTDITGVNITNTSPAVQFSGADTISFNKTNFDDGPNGIYKSVSVPNTSQYDNKVTVDTNTHQKVDFPEMSFKALESKAQKNITNGSKIVSSVSELYNALKSYASSPTLSKATYIVLKGDFSKQSITLSGDQNFGLSSGELNIVINNTGSDACTVEFQNGFNLSAANAQVSFIANNTKLDLGGGNINTKGLFYTNYDGTGDAISLDTTQNFKASGLWAKGNMTLNTTYNNIPSIADLLSDADFGSAMDPTIIFSDWREI